jgi:S1-C subfamily serine protease
VVLTLGRDGVEIQATVSPVKRPVRILLDPIDEMQETLQANVEEVPEGSSAPRGLRIADLVRGGRGEKARFKDGDVIVAVDKRSIKNAATLRDYIHEVFKEIFGDEAPKDRRDTSSYLVRFEVRTPTGEKVTRKYVNLFPDFLAPPVY